LTGTTMLTSRVASHDSSLTSLQSRRAVGAHSYYGGTPGANIPAGQWRVQSNLAPFVTTAAGVVHAIAGCNMACLTQNGNFVNDVRVVSSSGAQAQAADSTPFAMRNSVSLRVGAGETITCTGSWTNQAVTNAEGGCNLGCSASYSFSPD